MASPTRNSTEETYNLRSRRALADLSRNIRGARNEQAQEDSSDSGDTFKSPTCEKSKIFDQLLMSPPKQTVNYKPLSFWAKKVEDLETKTDKKKKKSHDLLYAWTSSDSGSSPGKVLKKTKAKRKKKPTEKKNNLLENYIKRLLKEDKPKKAAKNSLSVFTDKAGRVPPPSTSTKTLPTSGIGLTSTPAKLRRFRINDIPIVCSPISFSDPSIVVCSKNGKQTDGFTAGGNKDNFTELEVENLQPKAAINLERASSLSSLGTKDNESINEVEVENSPVSTPVIDVEQEEKLKSNFIKKSGGSGKSSKSLDDSKSTSNSYETCEEIVENTSDSHNTEDCENIKEVPNVALSSPTRELDVEPPVNARSYVTKRRGGYWKSQKSVDKAENVGWSIRPAELTAAESSEFTDAGRMPLSSPEMAVEKEIIARPSVINRKSSTKTPKCDDESKNVTNLFTTCEEIVEKSSPYSTEDHRTLNKSEVCSDLLSSPRETERLENHEESFVKKSPPPSTCRLAASDSDENTLVASASPLCAESPSTAVSNVLSSTQYGCGNAPLFDISHFAVPNHLSSTMVDCRKTIAGGSAKQESPSRKRSSPFKMARTTQKKLMETSGCDVTDEKRDEQPSILKGGKGHLRMLNVWRRVQSGCLTMPADRGRGYESLVEEVKALQASKNETFFRPSLSARSKQSIVGPSTFRKKVMIDTSSMVGANRTTRASVRESSAVGARSSSRHLHSIFETESANNTQNSMAERRRLRMSQLQFPRAVEESMQYQTEASCLHELTRSVVIAEDSRLLVVDLEDMSPTNFREAYGFTDYDGDETKKRTPRDEVLSHCNQAEPVSFADHFNESTLLNCKKIGEGVYGEVFTYTSPIDGQIVFKVIPIEGDFKVNDDNQKTYGEILPEIVITKELSNLRNGELNRTDGFTKLLRVMCVEGSYPELLLDLWDDFNAKKKSLNDNPVIFRDNQLFIILELAHGGSPLETFMFENAQQAASVFKQAAIALAVAERAIEFEHRDLHLGNVLVSHTTEKTATFCLDGEQFAIDTNGVKVAIIDFTLSRVTYNGCALCYDLANDPGLFEGDGDYQFDIYRMMNEECNGVWELFHPRNNIFWLDYLLEKLPTLRYVTGNIRTTAHAIGLATLRKWRNKIGRDTVKKKTAPASKVWKLASTSEFVKTVFM